MKMVRDEIESEQPRNHVRPGLFNPREWTRWTAWTYLLVAAAAWLAIRFGGDRWWLATLLLFGPRWVLSLPLLVIAPLAIWQDRRQLLVLLLGGVILFGPFMGLCLPLGRVRSAKGAKIRVLTCNVGGGDFDAAAFEKVYQKSGADIVALQECPEDLSAKLFPNWPVLRGDTLTILSRYPLSPGKSLQAMHPPHHWPRFSLLQGIVKTPDGDLAFCTVHLPSPRYGLDTLLDRHTGLNFSRMNLLKEELALRDETSREIGRIVGSLGIPVVIAGDFNMPVESAIYRQAWGDYANAFSNSGFGYGWTEKVELRGLPFGVRIDHILVGKGLIATSCWVDSDVGSDHLPLIAEIGREVAAGR